MRTTILSIILLGIFQHISATTLHVGIGQPYPTIAHAAPDADPGDTILVHAGVYQGGLFVADLQGTSAALIYILTAPGDLVIYSGGSNAWQFTDAAYLHIAGFIFQDQTGNGVNFDDGGSYETPSHHVTFADCTFRNINATGNNDLLKMSGIDQFEIRNCVFLNGSPGGSGIDMVGCHDGLITQCHFENQGSNSVQAKGGTSNIRIERNFFKNGGGRALNLGGSTGLQFFRPLDAPYEAAELKVYSNVFIGSDAPIAFVGSINCEVVNNTIYLPTKWVLRILQETVDPERFPPCGYNTFRNNIIYIDNLVSVECNIGPNTAPETFTFSNNFWYHSEDSNWPGPDLPVEDTDNIVGEDPQFVDDGAEDFNLMQGSAAVGVGYVVVDPTEDYNGDEFLNPRSVGAFEGGVTTAIHIPIETSVPKTNIWPNPTNTMINIDVSTQLDGLSISLISLTGVEVFNQNDVKLSDKNRYTISPDKTFQGLYILKISGAEFQESHLVYISD